MAKVVVPMPEHDITVDVSTNPEFLLMIAEQEDQSEGDVLQSFWLAGQAVTKPQRNDD